MTDSTMERNRTYKVIEYVVACVSEFSERFKLTTSQAYSYLRRYKAIDFLIDCYDAEHTLSIEDAVEDMKNVSIHNGGRIA